MSKQALLVVDMQQGLFFTPRHDADGLVSRINDLTARLRANGSPIVFIQHCGPAGDDLHPSQPGFALHGDLSVEPDDAIITKASCDAFLNTKLAATLAELEVEEVIVTGCVTDFCVTQRFVARWLTATRQSCRRTAIPPLIGHTSPRKR